MPKPKEDEKFKEFISRCIPVRRKEHPKESKEQSIRVCYEIWRKQKK